MTVIDIAVLLLFAAYPIRRFAKAVRDPDDRPGFAASLGIVLCIALSLGFAGIMMVFSLFY